VGSSGEQWGRTAKACLAESSPTKPVNPKHHRRLKHAIYIPRYPRPLQTTTMAVEILIVGAGAVGAFYGSRLAAVSSTRVSALCRSNYKAVKENGFSVTSPSYGSYTFKPYRVFSSPGEARNSGVSWDYLVVSTKALPDVSDDSAMLDGLVGPSTAIVLVQNGLGVEDPYKQRFPDADILSAVTIVSAAQPSHGVIKHNRWTRISIGPYLPHLDTARARTQIEQSKDDEAVKKNSAFVALLKEGGIKDAEAYEHAKLQLVRWHKLAINASMNPSAVLSGGATNNEMSLDPELYIHLQGVMHEILETAPKILGKPFPKEFATADQILRSTQKNTSGSKPSMLLDWEGSRRLELEVILGNPVRIARNRGFEMPRCQTLYALLRMAQERRQKQSTPGKSSL